jgi:endo-1,4-beta-xylanase
MKKFCKLALSLVTALSPAITMAQSTIADQPALKDLFAGKFLMGVALNSRQAAGQNEKETELIKHHFNAIVSENDMKSASIHPQENTFNWGPADNLVQFGVDNNITVTGHCLIWHSQLAPWFCVDSNGQPVSAEVLKQRMRDHIYAVVGRYKGKIRGWDVVNEAIVEDGSYRDTPFYRILGEEFIPLAFQYAHEADPDAELYYNDYGMNVPGRRNAVVKMVNDLKKRGLRIDAIGMQSHIGMDYPDLKEFEESLNAFVGTGCKVMITELDMSALPTVHRRANVGDMVQYRKELNPYPDGLPDEVAAQWNTRMAEFFNLLLRHSDDIIRVTAWGLTDGDSWKNGFPVRGRVDYPLLFDRNLNLKGFVNELSVNK